MVQIDDSRHWWSPPFREAPDESLWYRGAAAVSVACSILKDEPERSRRVARLVFANWLAQADTPWPLRPAYVHELRLYDNGPGAPPASRALPPEDLARWYDSTLIARAVVERLSTSTSLSATNARRWRS